MRQVTTDPAWGSIALLLCALCALAACAHAEPQPTPAPPEGARAQGEAPFQMGPVQDQVFYFVMLDRFYDGDPGNNRDVQPGQKGAWQGGDLKGLMQKLDYLQQLGVTALWITPIVDQVDAPVHGAGFPDWAYHGYWADDFQSLEARLGTEAELRELLQQAHARGMAVILDVVINHAGYGSRWETDASMTRSPCPAQEEATELTACLFGLPDFRTEDPQVRERVLGWTLDWARRFPLDGFRLDTLKHVEPEAFAALGRRARALALREHGKQRFLMLGEWWGAAQNDDTSARLMEQGVVDTLFDFSFHGLAEGFVSGRMRAEAAAHHLERRHQAPGPPLVHFLDSHDVPTFFSRLDAQQQQRYPMAAVLQMTIYGAPVVTWGDELGRAGGEWPLNRQFMPWEALETPQGQRLFALWSALIKLRRQAPALRGAQFHKVAARSDEQGALLAYWRGPRELAPGQEAYLVVLARGAAQEVQVDIGQGDGLVLEPVVFSTQQTWSMAPQSAGGTQWSGVAPADTASIWRVRRTGSR